MERDPDDDQEVDGERGGDDRVELDGDLDVVLGSSVLRNNGDGTFKEIKPFGEAVTINNFISADLDGDGDPDAAMIESGRLRVFINERLGSYRERPVPGLIGGGEEKSLVAADLNRDGLSDLLLLKGDKRIFRLADKGNEKDWEVEEVARVEESGSGEFPLLVGDLDNNGALDLVWRENIWLSDAQGKLQKRPNLADTGVLSLADVNGDGRLDLMAVKMGGLPMQLINRGAKNYHYQVLRPRAAKATGDQRINSFGVGGYLGWSRWLGAGPERGASVPRLWPGIALYYAVFGFNLAVTAWLAAWTLPAIGGALHGSVAVGLWRARQRSGAPLGLESHRA